MKALFKVIFVMALMFSTSFLAIKLTGYLNIDQIESLLNAVRRTSPLLVGSVISLLLFADLFIAVPTLSLCILSGYFLGFYHGVLFSFIGISAAGISGYFLSYIYGEKLLGFILRKPHEKEDLRNSFKKHGVAIILLSRAMPILPEISACLSGMARMNLFHFLVAWFMSSVPYLTLANYAGSMSSLDNPSPAIFTAIGLTLFFWASWFCYKKITRFNQASLRKYLK